MVNSNVRLYLCEVLSVEDPQAGLRIKVRLTPDDISRTDDELPYCFPFLPKMIHNNPKVGESVIVFVTNDGLRFFIGPIISQQYGLNWEPHFLQARCLLPGMKGNPHPDPAMKPEAEGTYPDREDIAIQGRQNTLVNLKNNEIRLMCGFKKDPVSNGVRGELVFNREDLAYIQMKYKRRIDQTGRDYYSSINMVADRINLISHDSTAVFNLNDRKDLITDKEMEKILKEAHPMVYGDELIAYLKELIELIRTHYHPFSKDKPCLSQAQNDLLNRDLSKMLSTSVKFN